ncbi:MAG: hypothetical protein WKF57_22040 [Nakamurella sp.]
MVDEAQFFTDAQIEQMAQLVDDTPVDVYAFGIATDFLGRMFPGSRRLFELADESMPLQVEVLCWCGRPGRFNARSVHSQVAREDEQVVVADTVTGTGSSDVQYQVLCRRHYRIGDLGPSSAAPRSRSSRTEPGFARSGHLSGRGARRARSRTDRHGHGLRLDWVSPQLPVSWCCCAGRRKNP